MLSDNTVKRNDPLDGAKCRDAAPLISIIVAVFNGKTTLQQCIDSIATQTYPNTELIVIDGGSNDGTVELLKDNEASITYWISEPDRGIYHAWNKGLAQAKGEWICFLGADDYFWDGTVLERMVVQLQLLPPDIRVAYGEIMQISEDGQSFSPMGKAWNLVSEPFKTMPYMNLPHAGTMQRRSLFDQRGVFDESFRIAGDYEFLLRELKTGAAAFIPNIITVGQRLGGISTAPGNHLISRREVRRAQKMHGLHLLSWPLLKEVAMDHLQILLWKVFGDRLARKLLDQRRRIKGLPPHWTKS